MKAITFRALAGAMLFSFVHQSWAYDHLHKIVSSGERISGEQNETFLTVDYAPSINNSGQVAFNVLFESAEFSFTPVVGIWSNVAEPTGEIIVSLEEQAPGAAEGLPFRSLGMPILNDLGQIAFTGGIGNQAYWAGVWLFENGTLMPVAVRGNQTPVFEADRSFYSFSSPILSNSGGVTFYADATLPNPFEGRRGGLWSFKQGSTNLIVESLQQFSPTIGPVSLNESGTLAFAARQSRAFSDDGIWIAEGRSLSLLMQEPSELILSGDFVSQKVAPAINSHGHVAFAGCTTWNSPCDTGGAWLSQEGTLMPLALSGQSVTIDEQTYTFTGSFSHAVLNDNNDVAFAAEFSDSDTGVLQSGIWLTSGGELRLIAAVDALPVLESNKHDRVLGVSMNSRGQIAFQTMLGIWATDNQGEVQPVARVGEVIDLDEGAGENLKTIRQLNILLSDRQSGRGTGFNDNGELAFVARFPGGVDSGVFVSSAVAIPEPLSTVHLVLATLILLAPNNRRQRSRIGL